MEKKEKIWLVGTGLVAGLIAGFAVGVVTMTPKTFIDRNTVIRCRHMMAAIEDLPSAENARFWRITNSAPHLVELWRVRAGIAKIRLNSDEPEQHQQAKTVEKARENAL